MKQPPVYVGGNRVLLRTANRYKMFVDSRDVSIAPHLILDGVYEEHTDAAIKSLIKPGMKILEIGANVGVFTLLLCHRTGSRGSVLAFECDPALAQIARDNIEVNGFTHIGSIDERAVSDCPGTLSFYTAERHRGGGTLVEGLQQIPQLRSGERRQIEVQATTIDAMLNDRPEGFDFVKIDAEGAESAIIQGGKRLFANRGKPLFCMMEFAPRFFSGSGANPLEQLEELASFGFRFTRIDERKRKIVPTTAQELLAHEFSDIVMVRS
ncbi:MAG TPA: FkbM family methyltransferase [Verrucomicrobiae bacterium]|jgi:FkbM family methyltransferase|nr:FkbM family methyltransferase [Verrucomicrobiae bacterium]